MTELKGEIWFLASCVELYKDEKRMSGQDAYNYLEETGALGFIISCWEGLHMTGPQYIIDSIDEFIKNNAIKDAGEITVKPSIAHISEDMTREQTLEEHLNGVSKRAQEFASVFGAGDIAGVIGLCHDVGKYSERFQHRIRGGSLKVDHSTAGGQLLSKMNNTKLGLLAAYCVTMRA